MAMLALAARSGQPLHLLVQPNGQVASGFQRCVVSPPFCGTALAPPHSSPEPTAAATGIRANTAPQSHGILKYRARRKDTRLDYNF